VHFIALNGKVSGSIPSSAKIIFLFQ
jgi:hypothetical protein